MAKYASFNCSDKTICEVDITPTPTPTASTGIIGDPVESKYGVADSQIIDAYKAAMGRGARRFGLHTMLVSNELNYEYMVETAAMLLEVAEWINAELDVVFDFINIGGGLGIPYRPADTPLDLEAMGK